MMLTSFGNVMPEVKEIFFCAAALGLKTKIKCGKTMLTSVGNVMPEEEEEACPTDKSKGTNSSLHVECD
jgi:hypothetical protein